MQKQQITGYICKKQVLSVVNSWITSQILDNNSISVSCSTLLKLLSSSLICSWFPGAGIPPGIAKLAPRSTVIPRQTAFPLAQYSAVGLVVFVLHEMKPRCAARQSGLVCE